VNLRDQLDADLKAAMKSGDSLRRETIRGIRGAVHNKEIETGEAPNDEGILRVIRSLVKQRADAIEQYREAGRGELADKEAAEKAILESYLPAAPGADDIEAVVREVVAEVGAEGPRDMGRVMKPVLARLGPAADGKLVSQTVKRLLGS
jgi:uncharacterized protein YqeY